MSDEFYPSFAIEPVVGFHGFLFFLCLILYCLEMIKCELVSSVFKNVLLVLMFVHESPVLCQEGVM